MIREERAELLRIRDVGAVDHEVLTSVLGQLDAEESALAWDATRGRSGARLTPAPAGPDRRRVRAPRRRGDAPAADVGRGLPHAAWPRACGGCTCGRAPTCGEVGCCDSSSGQHAEAHFHETGHPVMRSIEPGEAWRWCYVDEVLG